MKRAWILVAFFGCSGPASGAVDCPSFDRATFEAQVQPILAERCANPTCHGRPERALVVYAPMRYRADPDRVWIPEPLTAEELDHNFKVACVVGRQQAWTGGSLLLEKPLGDQVGEYHGGGVIFETTDRDWRALHDWVQGSSP